MPIKKGRKRTKPKQGRMRILPVKPKTKRQKKGIPIKRKRKFTTMPVKQFV